jgi:signal transduction histidine kinase
MAPAWQVIFPDGPARLSGRARLPAARSCATAPPRKPDSWLTTCYYLFGDDLRELGAMQSLVWRALAVGAFLSLVLAGVGALLFRRQIARRIADVRRTARIIATGNLSERIPTVSKDEFGLLNDDLNHMLDRIEQLMTGVRDVSNAIAHDLRTPLTRIRAKLEGAHRRATTVEEFQFVAHETMADIDQLIDVFQCLLQIAEAEAGVGTSGFGTLDLAEVAGDLADMYESTVEECAMDIRLRLSPVRMRGDRNLMATAIASLIENTIKYAAMGQHIDIAVNQRGTTATVSVRDHGPGVPSQDLPRLTERFYRLDKSRNLPGNGLGLSIVAAIVKLHGGLLTISNAGPGLCTSMTFPAEKCMPR